MEFTLQQYNDLVSQTKDTVYRLALSIVGVDVEAEDIAQEVYEKVWRARDAILKHNYPRAYVCRMTRNLAIDYVRRRHQVHDIDDGGVRAIPYDDGDYSSNLGDMTTLTKQLIARLPHKQRIVLHMRDVEGYDIEEIADAMESDAASIRVNLSRARRIIREQLIKAMNYGVKQD